MVADHALASERDQPSELSRGDPSQWGSRAVEFLSVRLIDASGQTTRRFDTGSQVTLDMKLLVHRDVGDFVCGMAIRRADGLLLAGTNTFVDQLTVSSHSPGEMVSVRYTIDSLPLLAGGYIVQVAVHDVSGSDIYDHADPGATFHVNNLGGHGGIVEMRGRWEVEQERDVPTGAVRQTAG
jgi:hypothetical protein